MKEKMRQRKQPLERIRHFNEFHTPLSKEEQELQGARCMDCGVPFCQSGHESDGHGQRLSPAQSGAGVE